jgi:hypothetical protein
MGLLLSYFSTLQREYQGHPLELPVVENLRRVLSERSDLSTNVKLKCEEVRQQVI